MNAASLRRQMKNGAYNFHWIAGLSLANSIYFVLTKNYGFVVGLGVTQFLDIIFHNIAQSFPNSVLLIQSSGLLLDVFICGVFILCGVLAAKRSPPGIHRRDGPLRVGCHPDTGFARFHRFRLSPVLFMVPV